MHYYRWKFDSIATKEHDQVIFLLWMSEVLENLEELAEQNLDDDQILNLHWSSSHHLIISQTKQKSWTLA